MKILLVGADKTVLENRTELLIANGFDATGIVPEEAAVHVANLDYSCLILGASLEEARARELGYDFARGSRQYVIRVADHPVAGEYPYAAIVVNPRSPGALLAAVKAIAVRLK